MCNCGTAFVELKSGDIEFRCETAMKNINKVYNDRESRQIAELEIHYLAKRRYLFGPYNTSEQATELANEEYSSPGDIHMSRRFWTEFHRKDQLSKIENLLRASKQNTDTVVISMEVLEHLSQWETK